MFALSQSKRSKSTIFRWNLFVAVALLCTTVPTSIKAMSTASNPKNIVVVGGGIQGTSVCYFLAKAASAGTKITILEAKAPASAASGKGGGFVSA